MENEILDKIRDVLSAKFALERNEITMETNLVNDLEIDSFALVELRYELQNAFKIKANNPELATLSTIGDLVDYIKKEKEQ